MDAKVKKNGKKKEKKIRNGTAWIGLMAVIIAALIGDKAKEITLEGVLASFAVLMMIGAIVTIFIVAIAFFLSGYFGKKDLKKKR